MRRQVMWVGEREGGREGGRERERERERERKRKKARERERESRMQMVDGLQGGPEVYRRSWKEACIENEHATGNRQVGSVAIC